MATLQDIIAATNPKAIDDMNNVAANSSALKLAQNGLTAEQLASLNDSPDQLSRVIGEAAKMKGAVPPAPSITDAVPVGASYDRAVNNPVQDAVDKIKAYRTDSSPVSADKQLAPLSTATKDLSEVASKESPIAAKFTKLTDDLHALPEDQLLHFGKLGDLIKSSKIAQAAAKFAKPLGALGAMSEAGDTVDSIKQGEYGNAVGHGLGVGSGIATAMGAEAALPLGLASLGVLGGMKQGKELADSGVDENGMTVPAYQDKSQDSPSLSLPGLTLAANSQADTMPSSTPAPQGEGPVTDPKQYAQTVDGVLIPPGEGDGGEDGAPMAGPTPDVNGHTNGLARDKLLALMQQYRAMGNAPTTPTAGATPPPAGLDPALASGQDQGLAPAQSSLQQILAQAADQRRTANILSGVDRISAGIAGNASNAPIKASGQEAFADMAKQADQGAKDYVLQKDQEKLDPKSAESKSVRDYLSPLMSKMGMDPKTLDNMSYTQIKDNFPLGMKMYMTEQAQKNQQEIMKLKQAQLVQSKQNSNSEKEKLQNQRLFSSFTKTLPTIGGAQGNVLRGRRNQSANIFNTFQLSPDMSTEEIEKLDPKQLDSAGRLLVTESSVELNKLLSGSGSPAQKTLEKIVPHNILMDTTKLQDYFTSKMNSAQQGQFAKEILKIAARVRKTSTEELNDIAQKTLSSTRKFRDDPELAQDYQSLLDSNGFVDPDEYQKQQIEKQAKMKQHNTAAQVNGSGGKQVAAKGYNAKTNQTQFVYTDGSKEIVDGQK